jgi:hypothetical protein
MRPGTLRLLPPSPAPSVFALLWLLSLAGVVYALRRKDPRSIGLSTGLIAYLALFFLFVIAMPLAERYRYEKSFAAAVRSRVDGNAGNLALYRIWGPGLIYYLSMPRPIPSLGTPEELAGFAESNGGAWVITREQDASDLKLRHTLVGGEPIMPWQPPSERRGRYVLIRIR